MSARNIYFPILMQQTPEEFGERLASNAEYASRWAREAAVNGNPEGQLAWGQMLLNGYGTTRDMEAAFRWFSQAARAGLADAFNMVGRCHERGWGVPIDAAAAVAWYRRAADKGHAWAQYNLGCQYLHGSGVAQDYAQALSLFVRSARQGNEKAMNKLGRFREEGWHCRAKLAAAKRWYARAAARGCFRGQFHTGRLMMNEGNVEGAVQFLSASCNNAPLPFCREVGTMLSQHPNQRLASIGREALARADQLVPATAAAMAATALITRAD